LSYLEEKSFMKVCHKAYVKWASLLACILALTLFLVACGNSGGTTTTTSTPTPTPTPTGTTYTGDGYTLTYPQGWTQSGQALLVVFTNNSDANSTFTISAVPVTPITTLDKQFTVAQDALKNVSKNYQPDSTVPSTASVGGDTWQETGATFDDQNGQHMKGVVLADQHAGKIFAITLKAKADSYDQTYNTVFKPMLDSFKFV
jgi:hypothetical protein